MNPQPLLIPGEVVDIPEGMVHQLDQHYRAASVDLDDMLATIREQLRDHSAESVAATWAMAIESWPAAQSCGVASIAMVRLAQGGRS